MPTASRQDPHPIPHLCFGPKNDQQLSAAQISRSTGATGPESLAMAVEGSQTKKLKVATMAGATGATAPAMVDHALVEADEACWSWRWPWDGEKIGQIWREKLMTG